MDRKLARDDFGDSQEIKRGRERQEVGKMGR
jgi:hypothetical protein